jgi:hypothetical protein
MELWIVYYISFAVSGALLAWIRIFRPSMHLLGSETEGDHPILRSQFMSGMIWFGLSTLVIPILIWPLLNEQSRVNFIISLTQGFLHRSQE